MTQGKLTPQAIDAENAVLAAILLEKDAFIRVSNILTEESFYNPKNAIIFRAAKYLSDNSETIDLLTITEQLKSLGELENIGGRSHIVNLTANIASASNIEAHAEIIQDKAILRNIISYGQRLLEQGYNGDLDETFASMTSGVEEIIKNTFRQSNVIDFKEGSKKLLEDVHTNVYNRDNGMQTGYKTGFETFDKHTGGLHNSDLTIIAARPGMGKTAVAVKIGVELAKLDCSVMFFSLEMSALQLMQRAAAGESDITYRKMRSGELNQDELDRIVYATERIENLPFKIDDKAGATIEYISASARQQKLKGGLGAIFVDYLQLISSTGKHGSREQEVSHITRMLKILAKELDVPVIALSQLNREVDNRTNNRPKLSDLRESGAIEQDADNVIFIYRPWVYSKSDEDLGDIFLLMEKCRSGGTGDFAYHHNESISIFWLPNETKPTIQTKTNNYVEAIEGSNFENEKSEKGKGLPF